MEVIVTIFIAAGVIAIAAVLFGGWMVYMVARGLGIMIGRTVRLFIPSRSRSGHGDGLYCRHVNCRANNADHARFCRRCGRTLVASQKLPARQAALW